MRENEIELYNVVVRPIEPIGGEVSHTPPAGDHKGPPSHPSPPSPLQNDEANFVRLTHIDAICEVRRGKIWKDLLN